MQQTTSTTDTKDKHRKLKIGLESKYHQPKLGYQPQLVFYKHVTKGNKSTEFIST